MTPQQAAALVQPGQVHRDLYLSDAVFELERQRVWARSWLFVGHDSQVPQAGDYRCQDIWGGVAHAHTPAADEIALAEAALAAAPGRCAYARVDMLRLDGRPVLIELELIEPSLFLDTAPGSERALADIVRAAAS